MTPLPDTSPDVRVALVSGAYGYNGRLLYFEPIFRELARRLPDLRVFVDEAFPVSKYPDLPLVPDFRSWVFRREAQTGSGYHRTMRIPSPRNLVRLLRFRPHVVVVIETTATAALGIVAAWITRTPLVALVESDPAYRSRGSGPTGAAARLKARLVLAAKRLLLRRADVVLVSNPIGRAYLEKTVRIAPERILVGPYLTSVPVPPSPLPTTPPARLLFVNSLTVRKGVAQLLAALEVVGRDEDWRLDVVGDGDQRAALEADARSRGLADRVTFHGRVDYDDLTPYFQSAGVVVSPSLVDYRSLGGFEAVGAARILVASRYDGAHVELVETGDSVLVGDPLDTESYARTLVSAMHRAAGPTPEAPARFSVAAVGENVHRAALAALARRNPQRASR